MNKTGRKSGRRSVGTGGDSMERSTPTSRRGNRRKSDSSFLSGYGIQQATPSPKRLKMEHSIDASPIPIDFPAAPVSAVPASYNILLEVSCGSMVPLENTDPRPSDPIKPLVSCTSDRYMFEKPERRRDYMRERLSFVGKEIAAKLLGDDPLVDARLPHQQMVRSIVRIACEGEGKMNANSVLLETERGHAVKADLSRVKDEYIFPGQIVVVEGKNPLGNLFSVHKIHAKAPFQSSEQQVEPHTVTMLVAAGPFCSPDRVDNHMIPVLLDRATTQACQSIVLLGPFLPQSHPHLQHPDTTLDAIFQETVLLPIHKFAIKHPQVDILLVPSLEDAHHDLVFSQPCFDDPLGLPRNVHRILNPAQMSIYGFHTALTSHDILFDMRSVECPLQVEKVAGEAKWKRILQHLLDQRSLYPIFPPPLTVPLDSMRAPPLQLFRKPDLLLVPSRFKYFCEYLDGNVLAVNPGQACKGTHAVLTLQRCPSTSAVLSRAYIEHIKS